MICLPAYFTPSNLLDCQSVPSCAQLALKRARACMQAREWTTAQQAAIEARDRSAPHSEPAAHAVALVHLADALRGVGRPGPTLEHCEHAQRLFRSLAGPTHHHNRAVCEYALGLVCHELGNDVRALNCYEAALQALDESARHGTSHMSRQLREMEQYMLMWVNALMRGIVTLIEHPLDVPFSSLIWMPVFRQSGPDGEIDCNLIAVPGMVSAINPDALRIDNISYDIFLPDGQRPRSPLPIALSEPVQVVEIRERSEQGRPVHQTAYGLIRVSEGGHGSVHGERIASAQSDVGNFVRDATGQIHFIGTRPHLIGGDLVAVLRRRIEY